MGSKVGSLDNASHKASGGNVKIEDRRLEWKTVGRTDARNPNYTPQGGNKKVRTNTEITLCPFLIILKYTTCHLCPVKCLIN